MSNLSDLIAKSSELNKYQSIHKHTWCSSCGNFGIYSALHRALVLNEIAHKDVLFAYDVGCSGNESDKVNAFTIHGLHGRVLPLASGIHLANPKLKVIAQAGDGATFSEGLNHLINAIRGNFNITFVCHNNHNYALTIGQASATTEKGQKMSGTPGLTELEPLDTLNLVLACNPSFVARTYSGDVEHMTDIFQKALNHEGFSYVEVLQVCPTFNKEANHAWYYPKLLYLNDDIHDKTDLNKAKEMANKDFNQQIPVGIIYQNTEKPEFNATLKYRENYTTTPVEEVSQFDTSRLYEAFR